MGVREPTVIDLGTWDINMSLGRSRCTFNGKYKISLQVTICESVDWTDLFHVTDTCRSLLYMVMFLEFVVRRLFRLEVEEEMCCIELFVIRDFFVPWFDVGLFTGLFIMLLYKYYYGMKVIKFTKKNPDTGLGCKPKLK